MSLFPLRPLQQRALESVRDSLRSGHRRPIVCAPTGFGKTVLAAHMVQGALDKGNRVAFVVPLLTLIDQTIERFAANGIAGGDIGVMQGDHPHYAPEAPVQICSVQTLASRGYPDVSFAVIDEVHLRYKIVENWIKDKAKQVFVGLSATPWARGLKDSWDDLLIPTSISELIAEGYLSPFRAFAPSHPDLKGVQTFAGDYVQNQLAERMSKNTIVADVIQTWIKRGEGRPTLAFAVDLGHAQLLTDQFQEAGVAAAYVDAQTSREDRAALGRELQDGALQVIVSVGTMTHGVDLPNVSCIILARPTKSEMLLVQCCGRGLRMAPGKTDCIFLDHTDSFLRLGLPTDIRHDTLRSGGKGVVEPLERKPPLPHACPVCAYLVPAMVSECPSCGHLMRRSHESHVHCTEGELVAFEAGLAKKLKRKINGEMSWEEKALFFGELRGYALERCYKEGWAANKYRDKTGVWPNDPRVRYAPVRSCGPATRSWIKSTQIRWANSHRKQDIYGMGRKP